MKRMAFALTAVGFVLGVSYVRASGPLGVYAIVEKVAFEPSEAAPQRIRITGAFAYVNEPTRALGTSAAKRGYMYFKLPDNAAATPGSAAERIRREWNDIKSVAGTGQAIGFGNWFYVGGFGTIQPDAKTTQIIEDSPRGGSSADMRVRPESEAAGTPVTYQTNNGVVKLSADGSNAEIVRALRDALRK
jgi:hypothetical protein